MMRRAWGPVERGEDFAWRGLASTVLDSTRQQRTLEQIENALRDLGAVQRVSADAADARLLQAPADFKASESLAAVLRHLETPPAGVAGSWVSCESLDAVDALLQQRRKFALALEQLRPRTGHFIMKQGIPDADYSTACLRVR